MQRVQDPVTHSQCISKCVPKSFKLFLSKNDLQILHHIQKQKRPKILQKVQINTTKPQTSQDLKHLTLKIV